MSIHKAQLHNEWLCPSCGTNLVLNPGRITLVDTSKTINMPFICATCGTNLGDFNGVWDLSPGEYGYSVCDHIDIDEAVFTGDVQKFFLTKQE